MDALTQEFKNPNRMYHYSCPECDAEWGACLGSKYRRICLSCGYTKGVRGEPFEAKLGSYYLVPPDEQRKVRVRAKNRRSAS